ncbi:MAG: hydroxymethylbilane synthase [Planctomycetes bacterium]|nr:hydroxymethylbilane synthase [Planctomycetota bacterium]
MSRVLRLATRASPLALWQARRAAALLAAAHPGLRVQLVPLTSSGDRDRTTPLYESPSVGLFVKEIQAAVLAGEADAGVHSCKDLPTRHPDGLGLAAVMRRADPRDALVGLAGGFAALPAGALVGTSSLRRQAQLAALRPDLRFAPIRGNVDTRLRKVAEGACAATVLALAGLIRLGLARHACAEPFDPWNACCPAPAQGAVALDCRRDDRRTIALLAALDHPATRRAVAAERTVLAALDGGCSLPLGCHARRLGDGRWRLAARLGRAGGLLRFDGEGTDPAALAAGAVAALRGG